MGHLEIGRLADGALVVTLVVGQPGRRKRRRRRSLPALVSALVQGETLPAIWPVPILAMSLYTVLLIGLAIWRFNREEF